MFCAARTTCCCWARRPSASTTTIIMERTGTGRRQQRTSGCWHLHSSCKQGCAPGIGPGGLQAATMRLGAVTALLYRCLFTVWAAAVSWTASAQAAVTQPAQERGGRGCPRRRQGRAGQQHGAPRAQGAAGPGPGGAKEGWGRAVGSRLGRHEDRQGPHRREETSSIWRVSLRLGRAA